VVDTGVATFREVERKFRVHGLFRLPDLADGDHGVASVEDRGTVTLAATYHDTEDLRLAREGVTLRQRRGGGDEGWHLKLPVLAKDGSPVVGSRDEIRMPLSGQTPPPELLNLVTVYARHAPVRPVASLQTERATRLLRAAGGSVLAELVDDTVSVLDGDHVAARFRELELEAVEADSDALDRIGELLTSSGAVTGEFVSKAVRALGPRASAEPEIPEPPSVQPGDPAAAAVAAHLSRHARAFRMQDVRVRRDLPDAVHQMRVAARRIRSGLKAFKPLVDTGWADELGEELRWIAGVLGEVRDREVLLARLQRDLDTLPADPGTRAAKTVIFKTLTGDMAAGRADVLTALGSDRYLDLVDRLVLAATQPHVTAAAQQPCSEVLPPLVAKAWKRLNRDVRKLDLEGHDEDWHETRKAAKKTRYATEALVPVFGAPAKALAEQVERVTELLGEHQDAAIAAQTVATMAGQRGIAGATGFALGLLHGLQRDEIRAARRGLFAIWPEVHRPKLRRWLDA
jgi:CHAD domain-containing protein